MAIPILATKIYIPPPPPKLISRQRLIGRLDQGRQHKLTIISAPAGFGKSTLVSEWILSGGQPAAWLSLDENDRDPVRFLTYLISALQTVFPDLGAGVLESLQSPQPPSIEAVLTALLNELATLPDHFILVLDDYHLTDSRQVDEALTFFIEHLPPQIRLVLTTREDPALPVPRLRARGQLAELRAADLRFTVSEAAEFLLDVMGLNLSTEDVAALESRTEGWIAGLQLAALSMQGREDVHGFIQAFSGDHRYIVDYLVEEVLQRQPEPVRSFLLQTAILDRLNASLCDAVTGQTGGKARLDSLQRGNFFLIPLDDQRHWYRYHHLFAEVLRLHLLAEQPEQILPLHRRASEWYEHNGWVASAIHHALMAKDFNRAAGLIERAAPEMGRTRQESTLLGWFKALPDELLRNRPVLSVHYAGALLQNGQLEGVEARLREAGRWLERPADPGERPVYADEEDFQRLPATVAMYHAGLAQVHGDVEHTMQYARQVLELAGQEDDFLRGAASSLMGLASWTGGDLVTAYRMFAEGMAHLHRIGFTSDVIGGSVTLADICITQGRLREAMRIYERGLQLATGQAPPLRGAADMHVGMSELYREWNELEAAAQHLLNSQQLGELNGLPKNPYRWRAAMARLRQAQGDPDEALDLLEEAERLFQADFSPNVRPVQALRARVWLGQGRLAEALAWAHAQGLSAGDELSYLREFEHITLARVLLARFRSDGGDIWLQEALGLLARLRAAAEAGGRLGSAIEILALQALAHQATGDLSAALMPLDGALRLAEPEGYVRMFVDEGVPMQNLLRAAVAKGILPVYAGKLILAIDAQEQGTGAAAPRPASPASPSLVEPLSQRELDILRLFRTELSGPEIARELVIALSTVRTHTKSIYSKLGVNSRRAAVRRSEELGLI